MSFQLDHIAVVCADLDVGARWLENALGVPLRDGGTHARFGTHNKLLGLAHGLYLEVIAPDPAVTVSRSRWFALDHAPVVPCWGNWICRTDDFVPYADQAGPAVAMARGDLTWDITVPDDGSLPMDGGFPTLIQWADTGAHPATRLPDSGCRLHTWEVFQPAADELRNICPIDDPRVVFTVAQSPYFTATFDTPTGRKVIA